MNEKWSDGSFELDVDTTLVINYQEIREKLYYQVFVKGDEKGEHNLESYLPDADRGYIEDCIIERLEEADGT